MQSLWPPPRISRWSPLLQSMGKPSCSLTTSVELSIASLCRPQEWCRPKSTIRSFVLSRATGNWRRLMLEARVPQTKWQAMTTSWWWKIQPRLEWAAQVSTSIRDLHPGQITVPWITRWALRSSILSLRWKTTRSRRLKPPVKVQSSNSTIPCLWN